MWGAKPDRQGMSTTRWAAGKTRARQPGRGRFQGWQPRQAAAAAAAAAAAHHHSNFLHIESRVRFSYTTCSRVTSVTSWLTSIWMPAQVAPGQRQALGAGTRRGGPGPRGYAGGSGGCSAPAPSWGPSPAVPRHVAAAPFLSSCCRLTWNCSAVGGLSCMCTGSRVQLRQPPTSASIARDSSPSRLLMAPNSCLHAAAQKGTKGWVVVSRGSGWHSTAWRNSMVGLAARGLGHADQGAALHTSAAGWWPAPGSAKTLWSRPQSAPRAQRRCVCKGAGAGKGRGGSRSTAPTGQMQPLRSASPWGAPCCHTLTPTTPPPPPPPTHTHTHTHTHTCR